MSWYYSQDRDADAARVQKELAKRRARGEALAPILPGAGRDLSKTFWGQAWNKNLLAYSDYESRMPRGRTYFRGGKVMDLAIEPGVVTSVVAGSDLYEVEITIQPLAEKRWQELRARCQGQVGSLLELLSGKLSAEVMRQVTDLENGLFPAPRQIKFSCSCPDWAGLCKHSAATLYAVGSKLDAEPMLFFTLRGIDAQELTGNAASAVAELTKPSTQAPERAAAVTGLDLSAVFGIDLSGLEALAELALPPAKKVRSKAKR